MEYVIENQTMTFLMSVVLGAALSAFYDVFRILRIAFRTPKWVVVIQDIIYFIICAVITFMFLLNNNYGMVRAFVIIGEILGWIIYYLTLGNLVIRLSKVIINFIKFALKLLFNIFIQPFYKIYCFFRQKFTLFFVHFNKKLKKQE